LPTGGSADDGNRDGNGQPQEYQEDSFQPHHDPRISASRSVDL
jgi:hypothetical protein